MTTKKKANEAANPTTSNAANNIDKEALKDWIDELEDPSVLKSIQSLKRSHDSKTDFNEEITNETRDAIAEANQDWDTGQSISHEQVMEEVVKHYSA